MECACRIKSLLNEKETELIKHLFAYVEKNGPKSQIIALLDGHKELSCPFSYSWGYEYYCDNQDYIRNYLENRKKNSE